MLRKTITLIWLLFGLLGVASAQETIIPGTPRYTGAFVRLGPDAASGNASELRFQEASANGTDYVGLKAPAAITASVMWVLPNADGTNGQALITDGAGTLSWTTISASGHNLLSSTHSDTAVGTVVRGDVIVGQSATPSWQRLALGTAGQYLRSDGTDALWSSILDADLPVTIARDSEIMLPNLAGGIAGANAYDFGGATSLEMPNAAGGTIVDAAGEVTVDTTTGTLNYNDGTAERVLSPVISKAITVENPTGTEDITMLHIDQASTVKKIVAVLTGSASPSVTWTIRHGTDRSAVGTEVVTGGTVTTSTTTGSIVTTFNAASIAANSFVWLETTAQSGTVTSLNVTLYYRQNP